MKKSKKIFSWVINIIVIIVAIMVLAVAVSSIVSMKAGYNSMFGYAMVAVKSDSMDGDKEDSFKKGDLLMIKVLQNEEKAHLQVGEVITFWDNINGKRELNTHRIIEVSAPILSDGKVIAQSYTTKGDNAPGKDNVPVSYTEVIGIYEGSRAAVLGDFVLFVQGSTGFLVLVVVPAILLLIYAVIRLALVLRQVRKDKIQKEVEKRLLESDVTKTQVSEEERSKLKAEILEEMSRGSDVEK